jgi:teichuronic acid exporter
MSLRARVLSGLLWTGGMRLITQIMTWAVTLVVIRLLTPSDYGLLAMATVFVSFLSLVAEAGLGPALIQTADLDELKLRRIFGAVILIDLALFVLQFAAAPAIAHFFEEDRLIAIIRALSAQFLLMIFTVIPLALLNRTVEFKRQSIIGLLSSVCGSLSSLALALSGYGVWALVLSTLITSACNAIAINLVAPFLKWPAFSLRGMRSLIVIGGQVTAARVLWFFYSQADIFVAGKLLGKDLLGFYSVSMHLASLPVQKLSGIINEVAYPAFAEAQHKRETLSLHILKALRVMSFFAFPVLWGISSIAPEIVAVLLGAKWSPAVVPLQLLPLVMPLTMLSVFLNTAFQGMGRSRTVLINVVSALLVMPAAFWIGSHWGLFGLSMAWLIGFPFVFLSNLWRVLPLVGLKLVDLLAAIARPALSAAGMYACVSAVRTLLPGPPSPASMFMLIGTGIGSCLLIMLCTNKKGIREVLGLFSRQSSANERV